MYPFKIALRKTIKVKYQSSLHLWHTQYGPRDIHRTISSSRLHCIRVSRCFMSIPLRLRDFQIVWVVRWSSVLLLCHLQRPCCPQNSDCGYLVSRYPKCVSSISTLCYSALEALHFATCIHVLYFYTVVVFAKPSQLQNVLWLAPAAFVLDFSCILISA